MQSNQVTSSPFQGKTFTILYSQTSTTSINMRSLSCTFAGGFDRLAAVSRPGCIVLRNAIPSGVSGTTVALAHLRSRSPHQSEPYFGHQLTGGSICDYCIRIWYPGVYAGSAHAEHTSYLASHPYPQVRSSLQQESNEEGITF